MARKQQTYRDMKGKTLQEVGLTWQNKDNANARRKQAHYLAANHPNGVNAKHVNELGRVSYHHLEPVINSKGQLVTKTSNEAFHTRASGRSYLQPATQQDKSQIFMRGAGAAQRRSSQSRPNVGRGRYSKEVPKEYLSKARQYTFDVTGYIGGPWNMAPTAEEKRKMKHDEMVADNKAASTFGNRYTISHDSPTLGYKGYTRRTIKSRWTTASREEAEKQTQKELIKLAGTYRDPDVEEIIPTAGPSPNMRLGRHLNTQRARRINEKTRATYKLENVNRR